MHTASKNWAIGGTTEQTRNVKIYFDLLVEILNLVKAKGPRSERCNQYGNTLRAASSITSVFHEYSLYCHSKLFIRFTTFSSLSSFGVIHIFKNGIIELFHIYQRNYRVVIDP